MILNGPKTFVGVLVTKARSAGWWGSPRQKLVVMCAALAISTVFVIELPWRVGAESVHGGAVGLCYTAALNLLGGNTPYTDALAWISTHASTDWRNIYLDVYTYSPAVAYLFVPLTLLPLAVFLPLWNLLSVVCAVYLAITCVRIVLPHIGGLDRSVAVSVALALVLAFGPLRHSMRDPEIDIELAALGVLGWDALRSQRRALAVVAWGIAIVIKPTFIFLLLYALWRREWRVAIAAGAAAVVATLVSLVAVSPAIRSDFLTVTNYWSSPGFVMAPKSISLLGMIERLAFGLGPLWAFVSQPLISKGIVVLVAAGVVFAAYQMTPTWAPDIPARDVYAFGMAALVMALASPLTEDNHLGLLLIVFAVFVRLVLDMASARDRLLLLGLAAAAALYLSLPFRGIASFSQYDGARILLAGLWLYGLLFVAALYLYARRYLPHTTQASHPGPTRFRH